MYNDENVDGWVIGKSKGGLDPAFSLKGTNSGRKADFLLHSMSTLFRSQAIYVTTQYAVVKMFIISLSLGLGLMQHEP